MDFCESAIKETSFNSELLAGTANAAIEVNVKEQAVTRLNSKFFGVNFDFKK